jgi:hypothetical protein
MPREPPVTKTVFPENAFVGMSDSPACDSIPLMAVVVLGAVFKPVGSIK